MVTAATKAPFWIEGAFMDARYFLLLDTTLLLSVTPRIESCEDNDNLNS
jgi:hypothetical protein